MKQVLETAGEVYSGFETLKKWCGALGLLALGVITLLYPLENAEGFTDEMPAWVGKVVTFGALSLGGLMLLALVMPEAIAFRARALMFFLVVGGILAFVGFQVEPMLREIHDLQDRGVQTTAVRVEAKAKVWPRKKRSESSMLLRYDGRTKRIHVALDVPVGGTLPILVDPEDGSRITPGEKGLGWIELLRQRIGLGWGIGGAFLIVVGVLVAFFQVINFFTGPTKANSMEP